VWFDRLSVVEEPYLNLIRSIYGAEPRRADFRNEPKKERIAINAWVEEETRDRIVDLIPANGIGEGTRTVLVNALYLKARWATEFGEAETAPAPFKMPGAAAVKTQFLRRAGHYQRHKEPSFEALRVPLKGDEHSVVIFRPDRIGGLANFESRLTGPALMDWLAKLRKAPVAFTDLKLPKVRIAPSQSYKLIPRLAALGMSTALSDDADFSGMAVPERQIHDRGQGVKISEVYHNTFFEMNESGVEAAAATAIVEVIITGAVRRDAPKPFYADRPFFFALVDDRTGAPLFLGRLVDPRD
jgi:serpin B